MAVIAFIPVRGGSKSIPLKNIKDFCGKPLVYWSIFELEKTTEIDEIIVATDSSDIASIVLNFHFSKVKIYHRSEKNASDTASTESVMMEYLSEFKHQLNDTFILVQATSPLTESKDFSTALNKYKSEKPDSLLSVVEFKRFLWDRNGMSVNYNFRNRPRRQDFEGQLMENGAFYINSIKNILENNNRLSGKISYHIMQEYTAFEIDEPNDWIIMEQLMYKHRLNNHKRKKIKLFATDVDGVLTDSGMYYSENGDELKKFNTRDGKGFELLRNVKIKTAIITSENTKIVERRAKKLKIDYLYQGQEKNGKMEIIRHICSKEKISLEEVAYIGDDINCIEVLKNVGWAACPSNANKKILALPNIQRLSLKGGDGVVREFIEHILDDSILLSQ